MLSLFLRIAVVLAVLLSLTVAVILAAPHDDSPLRAFLTSGDNCEGQCLLGIRPRTATVSTAMEQLQAHAWVESAQLSATGRGFGQIRWQWSGQQPAFIDERHPGRITFYWDDEEPNALELDDVRIETISIHTRIPMFYLQNWYGSPDTGTAGIRPDGSLGYSAAYHRSGVTFMLSTQMSCPVTLLSYWNSWTRMSVSIGQGTSEYVAPLDMVHIC